MAGGSGAPNRVLPGTIELAEEALAEEVVVEAPAVPLDADLGGVVTGARGARIEAPAGAFVTRDGEPVQGTVEVHLTPLNPAIPAEYDAYPGDGLARTMDGSLVQLETFGVLDVTVLQWGAPDHLSPRSDAPRLIGMDRRRWIMVLGGALLMGTTGCVRSVWFTQPLRETYEIGVVASPMGGDALAPPDGDEAEEDDADASEPPSSDAPDDGDETRTAAADGTEAADDDAGSSAGDGPATTTDAIAPNQLPARSPDQLQYFVSERLVLQREATSRDGAVMQGKIKVRRGRFVEQVVVPRKTPGIAVDWGEDWVAISFEADSALVFAIDGRDGTPKGSDVYHLRIRPDAEGGPTTVSLRGQAYQVRQGHNARLMVRRDTKTKRSRRRRIMRGRTIE